MRGLKRFLFDTVSGFGLSILMMFIPYDAIVKRKIGFTIFPASGIENSAVILVFLALSVCCGVFALGPCLRRISSRLSILIPSVIIALSALYVYASVPLLNSIASIILWIPTIALIPIGAIPAGLLLYIVPNASGTCIILVCMLYGMILGVICEKLFSSGINASRQRPTQGYSGASKTGYVSSSDEESYSSAPYAPQFSSSYQSSISYSSSSYSDSMENSSSTETDGSSATGYGFGSFSENRKNAWGHIEHYDQDGIYAGESRENAWGNMEHYNEQGELVGESRLNAWGNTEYYDGEGNLKGESRVNAWGNTDYYDAEGNYFGESRVNAWGNTEYYDANGELVGESRND